MERINRLQLMTAMSEVQTNNDLALKEATELLESATYILRDSRDTVRTWWTGSLQDLVWRQIHMAEAYIVSILPDAERKERTAEILFGAQLILDPNDPVVKAAASYSSIPFAGEADGSQASAGRVGHTGRQGRAFTYGIVRRYREVLDNRYTALRMFRNRLIVLTAFVMDAVITLIAAGSVGLIVLDTSTNKSSFSYPTLSPGWSYFLTMITIVLFGSIGGFISGAGDMAKADATYNEFNLPWYQLFFKIAMGALTGVLGVLAVRGDLLSEVRVTMNNWSQMVIWALVFGASQQLITFMISRRAEALSTSAPPQNGRSSH
jgi:hypothetical protein